MRLILHCMRINFVEPLSSGRSEALGNGFVWIPSSTQLLWACVFARAREVESGGAVVVSIWWLKAHTDHGNLLWVFASYPPFWNQDYSSPLNCPMLLFYLILFTLYNRGDVYNRISSLIDLQHKTFLFCLFLLRNGPGLQFLPIILFHLFSVFTYFSLTQSSQKLAQWWSTWRRSKDSITALPSDQQEIDHIRWNFKTNFAHWTFLRTITYKHEAMKTRRFS